MYYRYSRPIEGIVYIGDLSFLFYDHKTVRRSSMYWRTLGDILCIEDMNEIHYLKKVYRRSIEGLYRMSLGTLMFIGGLWDVFYV